jgi:hypothetical protein
MALYKRLITGLSFTAAVVLLLGSGVPALAQTGVPASAKPDVHLTFAIHADGSNVMTLEIAVHPLIDPAVRQALDWVRQRIPKGSAASVVELRDTTREGRKYAALVAQLNSIGDLNAFVNTPQLLSSVLKSIDASMAIPNIFSWFEVLRESSGSQTTYKINASMDAATTRALAPINLTIHFRLPWAAQDRNTDKVVGTELRGNRVGSIHHEGVALDRGWGFARGVVDSGYFPLPEMEGRTGWQAGRLRLLGRLQLLAVHLCVTVGPDRKVGGLWTRASLGVSLASPGSI